jgi:hypothetical protein
MKRYPMHKYIFSFLLTLISSSSVIGQSNIPIPKGGISMYVSTTEKLNTFSTDDYSNSWINYGTNVNKSFSLSVLSRILLSKNIYLRLAFGLTHFNIKNHGDRTSGGRSIYDDKIYQNIFKLNPGIEWHLRYNKLDFYAGFDIPLRKYNSLVIDRKEQNFDLNGALIYEAHNVYNIVGGISFGLESLAGFNIFLSKHFSLGSELNIAYLYTNIGGNNTLTTTYIPSSYNGSGTSIFNEKVKTFILSPVQGSLIITYWIFKKDNINKCKDPSGL